MPALRSQLSRVHRHADLLRSAPDPLDPSQSGKSSDVGASASQPDGGAVGGVESSLERRRRQWREFYHRNKQAISSKRKAKHIADPEATTRRNREQYAKYAEKRRVAKMRYVLANRELINARRRSRRAAAAEPPSDYLRRFGMTRADYEARLAAQGGVCAICKKTEKRRRLAVDHCHETGIVRGLLCGKCNTAIGNLNDDPVLIQRAVNYLRRADGN